MAGKKHGGTREAMAGKAGSRGEPRLSEHAHRALRVADWTCFGDRSVIATAARAQISRVSSHFRPFLRDSNVVVFTKLVLLNKRDIPHRRVALQASTARVERRRTSPARRARVDARWRARPNSLIPSASLLAPLQHARPCAMRGRLVVSISISHLLLGCPP